jgi:hypothetical protein
VSGAPLRVVIAISRSDLAFLDCGHVREAGDVRSDRLEMTCDACKDDADYTLQQHNVERGFGVGVKRQEGG